MLKKIQLFSLFSLLLVFAVGCNATKVQKGSTVSFEYTGKYKSGEKKGEIFDSTKGKKPLTAVIGSGTLLKAFENKIKGMKEGSSKTFTLKAKDAYGIKDPKKVVELDRDKRFKDVELKKGATIFAMNKDKNGKEIPTPLKVVSFTDDKVKVDYNHPLAGEDLNFKVKIVKVVNPAAAPTAKKAEATKEPAKN